jgi:hypothetical protein
MIAEEYMYAYRRRNIERTIKRVLLHADSVSIEHIHNAINNIHRFVGCSKRETNCAIQRLLAEGDIQCIDGNIAITSFGRAKTVRRKKKHENSYRQAAKQVSVKSHSIPVNM